jgi:hypothetical protein
MKLAEETNNGAVARKFCVMEELVYLQRKLLLGEQVQPDEDFMGSGSEIKILSMKMF